MVWKTLIKPTDKVMVMQHRWLIIHSLTIHKANHKNHNEPFITLHNTVKIVYKLVAMRHSKNLTEEKPSINMNPNLE
jgi:hypothetical protein